MKFDKFPKYLKKAGRRAQNIARYGLSDEGRKRKKADKAKRREAKFSDASRWQDAEIGVRRQYGSYDEYLSHQVAKFDKIADRLHEKEDEDTAEFQRRFALCEELREARTVLCLGARLGTEVKALHNLGYFAVGIDLNPGEGNPYVLVGDFHRIVFPDKSVDAIYCNALDHVFDLERLLGEIRRLLSPQGIFIADLLEGFEEGFTPGEFEAMMWRDRQSFIDRIRMISGFRVEAQRDMGYTRRDHWTQVVFRQHSDLPGDQPSLSSDDANEAKLES